MHPNRRTATPATEQPNYPDTPLGRWAQRKAEDPAAVRNAKGEPILCAPYRVTSARLAAGDAFYLTRGTIPSAKGAGVVCSAAGEWPSPPVPGSTYRIRATFKNDARYGEQLLILDADLEIPSDAEGTIGYLAEILPHIGRTRAAVILRELRVEHCLSALEALASGRPMAAQALAAAGVPEQHHEQIRAAAAAAIEEHQAAIVLAPLGLTASQRRRVLAAYSSDATAALDAITANPYSLIGLAAGFGFATADELAGRNGIHLDDPRRIEAAILFTLETLATAEGHTHLPARAIGELASKALEVPGAHVAAGVHRLCETGRLVGILPDPATGRPTSFAHPKIHESERSLATQIRALLATPPEPVALAPQFAGALSPSQRTAAAQVLSARVATLTGPPGVGKTYTLNAILHSLQAAGVSAVLAAPTGKASRRMAEATGRPATTIHSLLGFDPVAGGFARNASNPIPAGAVVIDEASMLDVEVGAALFGAVNPATTRVILTGDPNQLPSVGAGNVLADILSAERVPGAQLTEILRQAADSPIIGNAHKILHGRAPEPHPGGWFHVETIDNKAGSGITAAEASGAAAAAVVRLFTRELPQLGYSTEQIQILCPQNTSPVGADALNLAIQAAVNPPAPGELELRHKGTAFRAGDRVIHVRNNRKLGVMNGEVGTVFEATPRSLTVIYEGATADRAIEYTHEDVAQLRLGYAITIHKSQGSEFPAVIVPVVSSNWYMLKRSLLYTATTRARRGVWLVGQSRCIKHAVKTCDDAQRCTLLASMLQE